MKKIFRILITVAVILIAAFVGLFAAFQVRYLDMNGMVDSSGGVIGADMSWYQGDADMEKLKEQGISFVYLKATEGTKYTDDSFRKNWERAEEADLPAGAYHFFSYDSSGRTQAQNFIDTVGDLDGRLLPVVDVEYYGDKEDNPPDKDELRQELQEFLDCLEEHYGVKPMIYTRLDLYRGYLMGAFGDYRKWFCSMNVPLRMVYWGDWDIWQYTDQGRLEGYSGDQERLDLNVLNRHTTLESLTVHSQESGTETQNQNE